MEEKDEDAKESTILDNADEIGWVLFGIMSTICMVIYQFFLVEFFNIPSTVSSKIALSILIGVIAIFVWIGYSIINLLKLIYYKRKLRSLPSQEVKLKETPQDQKRNIWNYTAGIISKNN